MKKIFIDTNVLIDFLLDREPNALSATEILSAAHLGEVEAFVSSLAFSHMFYLCRKHLGKAETLNRLKNLNKVVSLLAVDDEVIADALTSDFSDFEDAIQYYCAIQERNMGAIITNNVKDFSKADIPVMTAKTYLNLYAK